MPRRANASALCERGAHCRRRCGSRCAMRGCCHSAVQSDKRRCVERSAGWIAGDDTGLVHPRKAFEMRGRGPFSIRGGAHRGTRTRTKYAQWHSRFRGRSTARSPRPTRGSACRRPLPPDSILTVILRLRAQNNTRDHAACPTNLPELRGPTAHVRTHSEHSAAEQHRRFEGC